MGNPSRRWGFLYYILENCSFPSPHSGHTPVSYTHLAALDRQLSLAGCDDRRTLPFHKSLLAGELPLTVGGGIGQSRLCMQLLGKAHIGEVQASVWDEETIRVCQEAGVILL